MRQQCLIYNDQSLAVRAKPLLLFELCSLELNATSRGTCVKEWQHHGLRMNNPRSEHVCLPCDLRRGDYSQELDGRTASEALGFTAIVRMNCDGLCKAHASMLARDVPGRLAC